MAILTWIYSKFFVSALVVMEISSQHSPASAGDVHYAWYGLVGSVQAESHNSAIAAPSSKCYNPSCKWPECSKYNITLDIHIKHSIRWKDQCISWYKLHYSSDVTSTQSNPPKEPRKKDWKNVLARRSEMLISTYREKQHRIPVESVDTKGPTEFRRRVVRRNLRTTRYK